MHITAVNDVQVREGSTTALAGKLPVALLVGELLSGGSAMALAGKPIDSTWMYDC